MAEDEDQSGPSLGAHLVMPVVTDAKRASRALRWAVSEMEKRYKLMATCGARNIARLQRQGRGRPGADGTRRRPDARRRRRSGSPTWWS